MSKELGEAIIQAFQWCEGVFQHLTTEGENRCPKLVLLAGSDKSEIVHIENGSKYVFDIHQVMLSGGNTHLRRSLVNEVQDGENLLDMFAAIGNLSLQVLVHKKINAILIEKNENTFKYLEKTLHTNKISGIDIRNIDCRDLILENWADRIFMGYHDVDKSHLSSAVKAARTKCVLHLHPIALKNNYSEQVDRYSKLLIELNVKINNIRTMKVKDYSPNLHHIQVMFSIEK